MITDRAGRDYSGMTVNERLFVANLFEDWIKAAKERNGGKMIDILVQVDLTRKEAEESVGQVLSDPKKYGF